MCHCPQASPGQSQSSASLKPISYEGSQVWRTALRSAADLDFFKRFENNHDVSLWSMNPARVDYLVQSYNRLHVHRELRSLNLSHEVVISDVQKRIDASKIHEPPPWTDSALRIGHRLNFKEYPTLTLIHEYFTYLKRTFNSIVRIKTIGTTAEKRKIEMITISNKNPTNKKVLIVGGQHAREWIGITSVLYITNEIITNFKQQPEHIRNKDWYIIPVANPDGFEFTKTDRLWRKNRRKNSDKKCPGVDLNRNYPYIKLTFLDKNKLTSQLKYFLQYLHLEHPLKKNWQEYEVSKHTECEEEYAGPSPASEPETKAIMSVVKSKNLSAFVDFHSYGQYILYPWAYAIVHSKHYHYLHETAAKMSTEINNVSQNSYSFGTPVIMLYPCTGVAIDWVHSVGVPLCYVIEARDTGTYGFLVPPSQIEGTGRELLGAVRSMAKVL